MSELQVRKVLQDLKLAIDGTIIMSPHLLQAMDANTTRLKYHLFIF